MTCTVCFGKQYDAQTFDILTATEKYVKMSFIMIDVNKKTGYLE